VLLGFASGVIAVHLRVEPDLPVLDSYRGDRQDVEADRTIFNTPSHHRVHHATNPRYLDANYAGVLIIWDRMFGTFVPELDEDMPRYGIVKNIGTFNPLKGRVSRVDRHVQRCVSTRSVSD
jgi:sterol desaturase/sphingolipid hydroxylase (fatty acid hydroxylase superfamily)